MYTTRNSAFYDKIPYDGAWFCHIMYHNMTQNYVSSQIDWSQIFLWRLGFFCHMSQIVWRPKPFDGYEFMTIHKDFIWQVGRH